MNDYINKKSLLKKVIIHNYMIVKFCIVNILCSIKIKIEKRTKKSCYLKSDGNYKKLKKDGWKSAKLLVVPRRSHPSLSL